MSIWYLFYVYIYLTSFWWLRVEKLRSKSPQTDNYNIYLKSFVWLGDKKNGNFCATRRVKIPKFAWDHVWMLLKLFNFFNTKHNHQNQKKILLNTFAEFVRDIDWLLCRSNLPLIEISNQKTNKNIRCNFYANQITVYLIILRQKVTKCYLQVFWRNVSTNYK
jgi:hypothetical protein